MSRRWEAACVQAPIALSAFFCTLFIGSCSRGPGRCESLRCYKVRAVVAEQLQDDAVAPAEAYLRLVLPAAATKAEAGAVVLLVHGARAAPGRVAAPGPALRELRGQRGAAARGVEAPQAFDEHCLQGWPSVRPIPLLSRAFRHRRQRTPWAQQLACMQSADDGRCSVAPGQPSPEGNCKVRYCWGGLRGCSSCAFGIGCCGEPKVGPAVQGWLPHELFDCSSSLHGRLCKTNCLRASEAAPRCDGILHCRERHPTSHCLGQCCQC
mmetsp:Transcript_46643/g.129771  ORF Transcript_46643/g.129771 Transcript_46643/m.129771 type:complete len:266 (+) Transcript_46643:166-963(+)